MNLDFATHPCAAVTDPGPESCVSTGMVLRGRGEGSEGRSQLPTPSAAPGLRVESSFVHPPEPGTSDLALGEKYSEGSTRGQKHVLFSWSRK